MDELSTSDLQRIETEIVLLKMQTAQNIIEIGKRLIQAKESLPHGEWGNWLKDKVDFRPETASRYMQVSREFPNLTSISNLGSGKLFALLSLPSEERETFITENNVEDMTTRELQQAIKEKKALEHEIELANIRESRLVDQVEELEKAKPKTIEVVKEILPKDYHDIKKSLLELEHKERDKDLQIERLQQDKALLERKANLNDKEAKEYQELKTGIGNLTKQKNDISRQLKASTELSGLVIRIEHILKTELAPIKYSRAINEQKNDRTVQDNLKDIVGRVYDWCNEMFKLLDNKKFIDFEDVNIDDMEVIEYE